MWMYQKSHFFRASSVTKGWNVMVIFTYAGHLQAVLLFLQKFRLSELSSSDESQCLGGQLAGETQHCELLLLVNNIP